MKDDDQRLMFGGALPASLVVLLVALLFWALIKRSRFGTALYAVGSNEDAAFSNGISVTRTKFLGYTLAGMFYGAGGVFLSAQTLSGDPLVGSGMLLLIFAATILGGTRIGGGTWRTGDNGTMCFDPEGNDPEECYTGGAPGKDGAFEMRGEDGTVQSSVRKVEAQAMAAPSE